MFVVGPAAGVFSAFAGLSAGALSLALTPLALIASVAIYGFEGFFFQFSAVLMLSSLGILWGIGLMRLGKFLWNLSGKYIRYNISVARGGRNV
ncbi:DUF1700 domain-containing protein [Peribacillus glennii]|uniref:DUF1700 domain-containing protein n=1 Tax=Peribacillus glennii TaxID=2303991 RepID=A0A372LB98_9BACI|nr:DUF1700 domain-containing protein [Peribacillus glennii]